MRDDKTSYLQLVLTVAYVAALMVSNTITAKMVQLPYGLTITGGAVVFPITYVLSDVFSEVYGYRWSRRTCYISFAANVVMVGLYQLSIALPEPEWFEGGAAFAEVLGSTPRVLGASMAAFVVGDWANDNVFRVMREGHDGLDGFGLRAILSSVAGEVVDSSVFIPLAFLGTMPLQEMVLMAALEASAKVAFELVALPVTRAVVRRVGDSEGIYAAARPGMAESAD